MNLPLRLIRTDHDGWVFAVCKHGSWKPLLLATDWINARLMAR